MVPSSTPRPHPPLLPLPRTPPRSGINETATFRFRTPEKELSLSLSLSPLSVSLSVSLSLCLSLCLFCCASFFLCSECERDTQRERGREKMNARAIPPQQRPAKKVSRSCVHCKQAHVSCSHVKPCRRCVERGLDCVEATPKRRRNAARDSSVSPPRKVCAAVAETRMAPVVGACVSSPPWMYLSMCVCVCVCSRWGGNWQCKFSAWRLLVVVIILSPLNCVVWCAPVCTCTPSRASGVSGGSV